MELNWEKISIGGYLFGTVLEGYGLQLKPLEFQYAELLAGTTGWGYVRHRDGYVPENPTPEVVKDFIKFSYTEQNKGNRLPYSIFDKGSGEFLGITSYKFLRRGQALHVHLGGTLLLPQHRGGGFNQKVKAIMLEHFFEGIEEDPTTQQWLDLSAVRGQVVRGNNPSLNSVISVVFEAYRTTKLLVLVRVTSEKWPEVHASFKARFGTP